ncbi:MAG: transglycosylase, partial [Parasutterella sp.]|nr:transglycosylase [Parasutterella sp.]
PKASVAVDRRYISLGTPVLVSVSQTNPNLNFTKPVVAQDTGGAIKGPIRFDFFWGFGDEAGKNAGRQKSQARAWLLLPNGITPESL